VVGVRAGADAEDLEAHRLHPHLHQVVGVADDPDARAAADVRSAHAGQGLRHLAVGGEDAGVEEGADGERVRGPVGGADDDRLGLAEADGVLRELEADPEAGAGPHRGEAHPGDAAEDRDLRRRDVGDVPQQLGVDAGPRLGRAAEALVELAARRGLAADDVALAVLDVGADTLGLDLARRREVVAQPGAVVDPEVEPDVEDVVEVGVLGREVGGVGGCTKLVAASRALVGAQRAVAGELGVVLLAAPEAVPVALRVGVVDGLLVDDGEVAEPGRHVDVRLGAEVAQQLLHAGVLLERLDEGADGELGVGPHLVVELGELARLEAGVDPRLVVEEVELRLADEEVAGTEAAEGREPALARREVALESLDVGRARRDDAPAEDADAWSLRFHVVIATASPRG
jgi:hypothetical protein